MKAIAVMLLGFLVGPSMAAADHHTHTNRLIDSRDPYLLLHAHNPVDWYPWGPEAFAKARQEDKPIFLSVGYSTCYWCHVAERTLYSDPAIAELMNQWFVNVKVDREQLPDVDQVYMLARNLLTGPGGWPNNLFLTPDLKPFFAGSYFPPTPDPERRRPDFPTLLSVMHEAWTNRRAEVRAVAEEVHQAMRRVIKELAGGGEAPLRPAQWLARAREALLQQFDPIHGGLLSTGQGTKFPMAPVLGLLMADHGINRTPEVLEKLTMTLDAMAHGGIHDHLAGGFHRYSTERTWSVPHFEKMLYDNAQHLRIYAEAYRATGDPLYRRVAISVGDYLSRDMTAPRGGFYTAQDSQVDGEEGVSYLWTRREIDSILGAEGGRRLFAVYTLAPMLNPLAPPGAGLPSPKRSSGFAQAGDAPEAAKPGVLRIRPEVAEAARGKGGAWLVDRLSRLAPQRRKLLEARDRRPQPARDDKIVVALNGLAIQAFATGGRILRLPGYGALARRAAERIWALAYDPETGELKHEIFRGRAQTDGYLADYALFGLGLMALYDTTNEDVWRQRAASLADALMRRFAREDGGLSTTTGETDLLIAPQDLGDDIHPSGTSAALDLLLRLAAAGGPPRFAAAASRALPRLSGRIERRPEAWPAAIVAVNRRGPTGAEAPAPAAAVAEPPGPAGGFHIPDSADHVRATATARDGGDHDEIAVSLDIDAGYHINANPASLDYLIATRLVFDRLTPSRVRYPKASRFKPAFAAEALDVYEGTVELRATFPKGVLEKGQLVRAAVTVQACDDRTCLPPADLPVVVDGPN
ncbi:MAG: thioredoxin domain-containing protein [Kiloniellales bacterium]